MASPVAIRYVIVKCFPLARNQPICYRGTLLDHVTSSKRSHMMSKVPSRNSNPEIRVRKNLHRLGYRFRLHRRNLPGTPDIVLPKHNLAIFVNGCFWHGHVGCKKGGLPKTRVDYWEAKIRQNQQRDNRVADALDALEWNVAVIWQCQMRSEQALETRLFEIFSAPKRLPAR